MSGRKCEQCFKQINGYCPFDYACKLESFERYRQFCYDKKAGEEQAQYRTIFVPMSQIGGGATNSG